MLSMHSIREQAGVDDMVTLIVSGFPVPRFLPAYRALLFFLIQNLFETYFERFGDVDNLAVD